MRLLALIAPANAPFWRLPMARLAAVAGRGPLGAGAYLAIVTNRRHLERR